MSGPDSEVKDTAHFPSPSFTGPATATLSGGVDSSLYPGSIYSFNVSSFQPNGNIQTVADSVTGTWTYAYDTLNRLTSGSATAGACAGMNLGWSYDRYGNRRTQSASGCAGCSIVQPTLTFSGGNNRVDGWSYDAAGNVLNDGLHQYTYDAESRIATVADLGVQYVYDAEGRRVAKAVVSTGALTANYILGLGGEQVTELNGAGQWMHSNVFADARLIATYDNVGTHFHLSDWLGTRRVQAGVNGAMQGSYFSYPFGDGLATSGTDATEHHFIGKERDSETGLDYFGARHFSSNMARFMTPDPLGGHTEDPQTLNRYSYVRNNPLTLTDPTGLDFYLSCDKQSDTCQKDKAGNLVRGQYVTDDKGNKTFQATVVTSASLEDPNSGNTGTVNQNGVQITTASGTAQGIFINGTPEAHLQGSGDFEGFVFSINKSDEKTGVWADGRYTYTGSREQSDVIKVLSSIEGEFTYKGEGSLYNNHPGYLKFRFSSGAYPGLFNYGPSPHFLVQQNAKTTVPVGPGYSGPFHVDNKTGSFTHVTCAKLGVGCN